MRPASLRRTSAAISNHRVDGHLLLLGFSVLMVIAAVAMVGARSRGGEESDRPEEADHAPTGPSVTTPTATTGGGTVQSVAEPLVEVREGQTSPGAPASRRSSASSRRVSPWAS